jgi:hypothetical protein
MGLETCFLVLPPNRKQRSGWLDFAKPVKPNLQKGINAFFSNRKNKTTA